MRPWPWFARIGSAALALVAAALSPPVTPARAFVDCCRYGSLPPMLSAYLLPAPTPEDGLRRAAALGFDARIDNLGNARAALDRGYLAWGPAPVPWKLAGVGTSTGYPIVSPVLYPICRPGPIPDRPLGSRRGASHPNGALQVTGALALVTDLDAACTTISSEISWDRRLHPRFGPSQPHAPLGARSRTATTSDGTTLTLLAADDAWGPAARWLAEGGARWLGVTVSVEDLEATAVTLSRHGAAFERLEIGGVRHLLVLPDGPGGAVVLFHPADRAWGFQPDPS
jgi:hypothetical protein